MLESTVSLFNGLDAAACNEVPLSANQPTNQSKYFVPPVFYVKYFARTLRKLRYFSTLK